MLALPLALLVAAAAAAQVNPTEWTVERQEQFLLTARVVERRPIHTGVTGSIRVTLSDGQLTHDAHFQTIDEFKTIFEGTQSSELNFRDSYKYNIAAHRLDKLLGLNMVPVSVERKLAGTTGALTWWVDDVLMMEIDRHKKKAEPPDPDDYGDQMQQAWIFHQLVHNTDPNYGNMLITRDWKLWLIDFTRAFRLHKRLQYPDLIQWIDRRFYNALRSLERGALRRQLRPSLNIAEIDALLGRRDLIVKFFDGQIARRGEAAVFCDRPGH